MTSDRGTRWTDRLLSVGIVVSWILIATYLWWSGGEVGNDSPYKLVRWWVPTVPLLCMIWQISRWRGERPRGDECLKELRRQLEKQNELLSKLLERKSPS